VSNIKIPKWIIEDADAVYKHLKAARAKEARIIDWVRSKGYDPNESEVFAMLSNVEYGGEEFAKALEMAIEFGELKKVDDG
jgi:hypothetical protein